MVIALSIVGIWFGLASVALCACALGAKREHDLQVREPVINETTHPARLAA